MKHLTDEMKRYGITRWDIIELLGCSEKTLKNKMDGTSGFSYKEVLTIRNAFFPGVSLEYLFGDTPPTPRNPAA